MNPNQRRIRDLVERLLNRPYSCPLSEDGSPSDVVAGSPSDVVAGSPSEQHQWSPSDVVASVSKVLKKFGVVAIVSADGGCDWEQSPLPRKVFLAACKTPLPPKGSLAPGWNYAVSADSELIFITRGATLLSLDQVQRLEYVIREAEEQL